MSFALFCFVLLFHLFSLLSLVSNFEFLFLFHWFLFYSPPFCTSDSERTLSLPLLISPYSLLLSLSPCPLFSISSRSLFLFSLFPFSVSLLSCDMAGESGVHIVAVVHGTVVVDADCGSLVVVVSACNADRAKVGDGE